MIATFAHDGTLAAAAPAGSAKEMADAQAMGRKVLGEFGAWVARAHKLSHYRLAAGAKS